MKKKIISILLSSVMIFSMGISTVSAAAADDIPYYSVPY